MCVGSGAPPVVSVMLELVRLGRSTEDVPSENVVVRVDERIDIIEDEISISEVLSADVLVSSKLLCGADDEAGVLREDGSPADEGLGVEDEGSGLKDDETAPVEELVALLEGGVTLDNETAELLGTEGWLIGDCEDSLVDGSGVALLGSTVVLV